MTFTIYEKVYQISFTLYEIFKIQIVKTNYLRNMRESKYLDNSAKQFIPIKFIFTWPFENIDVFSSEI